jgi:hypothetical protein
MALSASYNYSTTRDLIIARALRIIGAIGQGETAVSAAVTEAAYALNEVFKEWQADGLHLWKTTTLTLTGSVTTGRTITISPASSMVTAVAPYKVLAVWYKDDASSNDHHLTMITKEEYERLTPKATTGTPTQCYYEVPRVHAGSTGAIGTLYFFPALSTTWIAANDLYASIVNPLMDFDAAGDDPDIPDYLYNALAWALADQLAAEYGVGLAERGVIMKKAMTHKAIAMSFDQEQGSLWLRPELGWDE